MPSFRDQLWLGLFFWQNPHSLYLAFGEWEHGLYILEKIGCSNGERLLELLVLLKSFADQIYCHPFT